MEYATLQTSFRLNKRDGPHLATVLPNRETRGQFTQ